MASLLNKQRPPVYCPGCSHEPSTRALDKAFRNMGLTGNQIAIVSDIGCSGLFDTFFHTHALHGLHGRALTYATGLKLARPQLTVVATMGDGGLGIGGAHFQAACRRNVDITLIILNNFNFGMTGGQASATTPVDSLAGSGFLNRLEKPLDVCSMAQTAGAPYAVRCSAYDKNFAKILEEAIRFNGFSVVDIWGICPGRYSRKNKLTPKMIAGAIAGLPIADGIVNENIRKEFGTHYRKLASQQDKSPEPTRIEKQFTPPQNTRQEVIFLGGAGQRIVTAGEILCMAAMTGGFFATQKNEYNITVLRGPSVSELILSPEPIGYTGIENPSVFIVLHEEGLESRKNFINTIANSDSLVIFAKGLKLPETVFNSGVKIMEIDFINHGIKLQDRALSSLAILAREERIISMDMLKTALAFKFKDPVLSAALEIVNRSCSHLNTIR